MNIWGQVSRRSRSRLKGPGSVLEVAMKDYKSPFEVFELSSTNPHRKHYEISNMMVLN